MIKGLFTTILILLFLVAGAQTATAAKPDNPGNSGGSTAGESETSEGSGNDDAFDIFKIQSSKKGLIKVDKDNFCPSETFSVGVVFPKSLRGVWSGEADVHLVIGLPNGEIFPFVLFQEGDSPPEQPMNLFEIDLSKVELPAGIYQFALVLTKTNVELTSEGSEPDGSQEGDDGSDAAAYVFLDPLDVGNWYQGFAGLVSAKAVKISNVCDELPAEPTASDNDSE